MKTKLTLKKIDTTGIGTPIVHINIVLKDGETFTLQTAGMGIRLNSNSLLRNVEKLINFLNEDDNKNKIRDFAKEIIKANKTLESTKSI